MRKLIKKEIEWAGKRLGLEVGRLAFQANEAVLASYGETVVLATVVSSQPREDLDYFPLRVDYEEKLYAGGLIKTSRFVKRETKPSDEAVVSARLIDHAVRPFFPKDFVDEVQVIITVLSVEPGGDPTLLSLVATSAALAASDIPWQGPLGSLRIALGREGEFLLNPPLLSGNSAADSSDLNLIVSYKEGRVVAAEGEAREASEERLLEALKWGGEQVKPLLAFIKGFAKEVGGQKYSYTPRVLEKDLLDEVRKFAGERIKELIATPLAKPDYAATKVSLKEELYKEFEGKYAKAKMDQALFEIEKGTVRQLVFKEGKRPDGRGMDEVRPLAIEVGVLPRTHGSSLFTRGLTQALTTTTLGSVSLEQLIQTMMGDETKRYIHHYSALPFSTGETAPLRGPGRREIGHGALAEKALLPVIPSKDSFPYTIRLVSEILSQNGSTSMAATCGSTLALMDAGVPIKAPVAGVAVGLMTDEEESRYVILTDIAGVEDFNGFMDLKLAGTRTGMTALQLDVKLKDGLSFEVLAEAIKQSKKARLEVLDAMEKVLPAPRSELSKHAPRIIVVKIDPKKIGEVIGPGGRIIKKIIEVTGADIDIDDSGLVYISSVDKEKARMAKEWVEGIVREPRVGEIFEGTVTRTLDFGAFVEILPGKEGLVHISELSHRHVPRVESIVRPGEKVRVKVVGIDSSGRINLSKKALEKRDFSAEKPRRPGYRTPYYRRASYRR